LSKLSMRISVDKEFWVPILLCLVATCALTFLMISTTVLAGHSDGGGGDNGGGGSGACDGNTATTTSVEEEFSHSLDVNSSVECETPDEFGGCEQKNDTVTRNSSLDFSQVLDKGQTPGDLTVYFSGSSAPPWSQGFSAYIDCRKSANDDCATEAMIERPEEGPQRSVYTEFNDGQRTVHDAEKWTISDIDDNQSGISLETRASSTIGSKNEHNVPTNYYEVARANIAIDDIQLQICEADDNNPPNR